MHNSGLNLQPGYTSPAHRREYPVRGKVSRHIYRATGFWIFKTTYPGLEIQLDQKELQELESKGLCDQDERRLQYGNPINVFLDE